MTSGWGVDATLDGNGDPISGTSDLDVRRVWGALYTPGIISGAAVSTSGSAMAYTVTSGVVAITTATGEVVMSPVDGVTVPTDAAPATGTRTDIIWVRQRFPSIDNDSTTVVEVGTVLPARAVALKRYVVSAGQSNTNAAVVTGAIDYSIPYGASLGQLHYWQNKYQGAISQNLIREGQGTFSLPTDRMIRFSYSACLSAANATGFDNTKYCEWGFLPNLDGTDLVLWTTPGLHQAWQTVMFERTVMVSAGVHTVNIGSLRKSGPGYALQWYGVQSDGYSRVGAEFKVEDVGPVK